MKKLLISLSSIDESKRIEKANQKIKNMRRNFRKRTKPHTPLYFIFLYNDVMKFLFVPAVCRS